MEAFLNAVKTVNDAVNGAVWGLPGLILLIGTGILLTLGTKVFQIGHVGHWWKNTIASVFKKNSNATKKTDRKTISQFQALCAALAATVGTGNIAGVAAAIVTGGPGAVFWMWVAAFFGMMTNFSENLLGIYYRRRNKDGEWSGGPMYYLRDGLGKRYGKKWLSPVSKVLAVLFCCFAILASFGIGNMAQINKIVLNMDAAFFQDISLGNIPNTEINIIHLIIGIGLLIIGALIIIGGLQRIARVAEIVVPFMAVAYVIGSLIIFGINIKRRVCVISKELDTIVDFVLHELHSGATLNEIIGAYDKTPKMEMVTIVDKHEYKQLMDYIRKVDPKAFVTVYSVSDMRYMPKK